jgi:uncharacterized protein YhaN
MTAPDFNAQREAIRVKIAANETGMAKVDARLGELALDVTLGNAAQSDLDAANAECARLQSNAAALTAAVAEIDRREAAQQAKDAVAARKRDEAEYERLMGVVKANSALAASLVVQLQVASDEACAAEGKALAIAGRLDLSQRAVVRYDLATFILARLPLLAPHLRAGYAPAKFGDEAGQRLSAVK